MGMVWAYESRWKFIREKLDALGLEYVKPEGAFYVFPSIRCTGLTSEEFCSRLLKEKNVAAVPGNAFGPCGEGNIRCCYATAVDKLTVALDRIADFVKSLKG